MVPKGSKAILRIELTGEPQAQIRQSTGQAVSVRKLRLEQLEERIAPGVKTSTSGGGDGGW